MSLRTSRPTKSVRANGPIGCLYPRTIAVSISFALATPSANILIASLPSTTPSLEVAKPGTSLTNMVVFCMIKPASSAIFTVSLLVLSCLTNSSNFIIGTGLKKCIPINRSGRLIAPAILPIDRLDVLVAKTAFRFAYCSTSWKICCLSSRISGTASIIKSQSLTAFSRFDSA